MRKKVSASRAALPRPRPHDLEDLFATISPEAAAWIARKPSLRAKLERAAVRAAEHFPGRPIHLRRYEDPESGDWTLFVEVERSSDHAADYAALRAMEKAWIHDHDDPKLEFGFNLNFRR
jgi:hypothetical protein